MPTIPVTIPEYKYLSPATDLLYNGQQRYKSRYIDYKYSRAWKIVFQTGNANLRR